jgi:hypothetical protein
LQHNAPILLEEPAERSQAGKAEMVCLLLRMKPIRGICNAETIAEDIMGGWASDPNTRSSLPFRERAVEQYHCLLLDEQNFAAEAFLQRIETWIVDQQINIQMPKKRFDRHEKHRNFLARFILAEFPEGAREKYPSLSEVRTANLNSGQNEKTSPSLMTAHHGQGDGKWSQHFNDCFGMGHIARLFVAIQNIKNRFNEVPTLHGIYYRDQIDVTDVLLLCRECQFCCCMPKRPARRRDLSDCLCRAALMKKICPLLSGFEN